MTKQILFSFVAAIIFLGVDCKDEPIPPCTDCPQPADTTSHEFTWQMNTFGDGSSSIFYDCAVINDTLAYAVGEVYLWDSLTGQIDPLLYNLAQWNGKRWELKRVSVQFRGNIITPSLEGVFAFSPTQIWLVGGMAIYGNDSNWIPYDVRQITGYDSLSFTKCWGVNSAQMYFTGLRGSLAYYNGTTWQKIESGTTLPIIDIWGSKNTQTGEMEILAVASDPFFDRGNKLLSISNTDVDFLPTNGLPWNLAGVWFEQNKKYYVVGGGMYSKSNVTNSVPWDTLKDLTIYKTNAVRGTGLNDIIVVGTSGTSLHYNGSTWRNYPELTINGSYFNTDKKNKTVAICGWVGSQAVVVIGRQKQQGKDRKNKRKKI